MEITARFGASVTVLIVVARYLITHYFAQLQQLKSLYGAFIAFPVLMVTVFVIWALVLYGAALVAEGFGGKLRWLSRSPSARQAKSIILVKAKPAKN